MPRPQSGAWRLERFFWPTVGVVVAMIDVYAVTTGRDSLSAQHRQVASSRWWPLLAGTHLYLIGHLYGHWPERFDPLGRISDLLRGASPEPRSLR